MNKCCFCEEYHDIYNNQYYNNWGKKLGYSSRILLESPNWYVIPTIGCLTVGYVLLVCKQHYLSLANLDSELYQEMLVLKEQTESVLLSELGYNCISFEHGTTNAFYTGANSVDHVHLHIVPFASKIWNNIVSSYNIKNFYNIPNYNHLFNLWKSNLPESYLLFQDLDNNIYYIPDALNYPSQFFRRCISPYLGTNLWDWKQEVHESNFIKTLEIFNVFRDLP